MSQRPALIGWQTLLADLALILFMVTAMAMGEAPAKPREAPTPVPRASAPPPAMAEPLAVWRAAPGGTGLSAWLAQQTPDPRQQLSIILRYPPGGLATAAARAQALAAQAGGVNARLVIEPAADGVPETTATLAFDRAPQSAQGYGALLARSLQPVPRTPSDTAPAQEPLP